MIAKFETPTKGKVAIDFDRIEAIQTDDDRPDCVCIVTHNDIYKVIVNFEDLFNEWLEFRNKE